MQTIRVEMLRFGMVDLFIAEFRVLSIPQRGDFIEVFGFALQISVITHDPERNLVRLQVHTHEELLDKISGREEMLPDAP